MSLALLVVKAAEKNICVTVGDGIVLSELAKPLGEIKAFDSDRSFDTAQCCSVGSGVIEGAISQVIQKAIEMKANLLVITKFHAEGSMAPFCEINGRAFYTPNDL